MRKATIFGLAILAVSAAVMAQTGSSLAGISSITAAVSALCGGLTSLLPVAAMLMIVIAGVIYAAGQVMGAETRARANVWATAALVGALIGIMIYAVAPGVLGIIYGDTIQCTNGP